jgi:hypothetical protein
MKLTWHIVKKDLRRLWMPLALWALLVVAQVAVGMSLLWSDASADPVWFDRMADYSRVLLGLDLLFAYVMIAALIHEDSLVGARVFWRTRPLAGGRLLGAKLLAAALMFGVLPVLIWLPWWLACHYGWRDVLGAVPEISGMHAVVVMAALLVATLTDTLGRFLAWTIMLVITLATLGITLLSLSHGSYWWKSHGTFKIVESTQGLVESRAVLIFAVLMAVIAIVVIQQFVARRPAWVFGQVLAGFVVAALIAMQSPWDWSVVWRPAQEFPKFEQSAKLAENITLSLDQARLWQSPDETSKWRQSIVAVGLLAGGVPEGLEIYGRFSEQTWRWADGSRIYRVGGAFGAAGSPLKVLGLSIQKTDPDYLQWLEERRLSRSPDNESGPSLFSEIRISWGGATGLIPGAPLTRAQAARIQAEPPAYTINAQFGLVQPEVQWELPLLSGDRHWLDRISLRIVQALEREDQLKNFSTKKMQKVSSMQVAVIESQPTSCVEGLKALPPLKDLADWYEPNPIIREWTGHRLVNRDRGNFAVGYGNQLKVRIGTVELSQLTAEFQAPNDWRGDGQWESQPHWFEKVTLVKTTAHEVARFRRELTVARFETQP